MQKYYSPLSFPVEQVTDHEVQPEFTFYLASDVDRPSGAKEIAEIKERHQAIEPEMLSGEERELYQHVRTLLHALAESQRENARLQVELKDLRSER